MKKPLLWGGIGAAVLLMLIVAALLGWWGFGRWRGAEGPWGRSSLPKAGLELDAPLGQSFWRSGPVTLTVTIKSPRALSLLDNIPENGRPSLVSSLPEYAAGSRRRPWWKDLQIEIRDGRTWRKARWMSGGTPSHGRVTLGKGGESTLVLSLPPGTELTVPQTVLRVSLAVHHERIQSDPLVVDVSPSPPPPPLGSYALARFYLEIGRSARAKEAIDRAYAVSPHDSAVLLLRGRIYMKTGDLKQARLMFREALDRYGEDQSGTPPSLREPPVIGLGMLRELNQKMAGKGGKAK